MLSIVSDFERRHGPISMLKEEEIVSYCAYVYMEDILGLMHKRDRERKGVMVKDLAQMTNKVASWICNIEEGKGRTSLPYLLWFCQALGISFPSFMQELSKICSALNRDNIKVIFCESDEEGGRFDKKHLLPYIYS